MFGLDREWGTSTYCNPPYGRFLGDWIEKGLNESRKGKVIVFLVPARTDTRWFHNFVLPNATEIRFIKGRLKFPPSKNPAPFPSMVIIFSGKKNDDHI
jgi:site-specific DNA-methyltransferase (adenine-specific)